MRERVSQILGEDVAGGMQVSTFHAFCARQLRIWSDAAGVSSNYSIWDTSDQRDAAKRNRRCGAEHVELAGCFRAFGHLLREEQAAGCGILRTGGDGLQ